MTSAAFSSFVQGLLLLASAAIVFRLYITGLYKHYPVCFAYFLFRIPNTLWPLLVDLRSGAYFYFYIVTLPIVLTFYFLLVMELYRLVLDKYRGLQTAGRWAIYLSLVGSLAVSILTLIPKIEPSMPQRSRILGLVLVSERGIETALAVFLLLLLALLSRYPIQLSRNVRIHAVMYSIFFFTATIGAVIRTVLGLRLAMPIASGISVLTLITLITWLILLQPEREWHPKTKVYAGTENERRLLLQLETVNAALLRASGRS